MYDAKVLADSVSPDGVRLTTLAVTMPRIVLAEQNTHRVFSRNTASSRAIPVKTRCDMIEANPFVPEAFGKNQKGMQADQMLDPEANAEAEKIWREALADCLKHARRLAEVGVHKQYANRLTEAFAWVTQIVTATEWDNYFNLRCHPAAQPEIQKIAMLTKEAVALSKPVEKRFNEWHLPLVDLKEVKGHADPLAAVKVSVARCAAVSYEKHGLVKSIDEEIARHDMMLQHGHMSPFEHQAYVGKSVDLTNYANFKYTRLSKNASEVILTNYVGNFKAPWIQYRKVLPNEDVFGG